MTPLDATIQKYKLTFFANYNYSQSIFGWNEFQLVKQNHAVTLLIINLLG